MTIHEMYSKKMYAELLDTYLEKILNKPIFPNKDNFSKKLSELCLINYTCSYLKCYKNFLQTCRKIFNILPITDNRFEKNLTFYLENILVSLIYFLINPKDSDWIEFDIKDKINQVISFIDKNNISTERIEQHKKVYEDFLQNKMPQYIIKILYPHQKIFQNHTFDLKGKNGYQYITVNTLPRKGSEPLTQFEVAKIGYTCQDPIWMGPDWLAPKQKYQIYDANKIINLLILLAGNGLSKKSVSILSIEQVSTIEVNLMDADGSRIGWTSVTDFTAFGKRSSTQYREYLDEEFDNLNVALVNMIGCEHFAIMYQQAKNNMLAGLYVESFLLLSSVFEAMFYYWTKLIATKFNIADAYTEYIESNVGGCLECDLYNQHKGGEIVKKGMKPSIFSCVKFLKEQGVFNQTQYSKLNRLISKAKNDNLRNDVVHGRTNEVTYDILMSVDNAILEIQKLFCDILEIKES